MAGSPIRMPYVVVGVAHSQEELQAAMEGLVHTNRAQIRAGDVPGLYESGVVYVRERKGPPIPGVERFQTARDAYHLGHSDCDGLAPWRTAELQERGEPATVRVIRSPVGYHVVTIRGDGRIEDPSANLGMLDGVSLGDAGVPATDEAQERRVRRGLQFLDKAKKAARMAGRVYGAPARGFMRVAQVSAQHASALLDRADSDSPAPTATSAETRAPLEDGDEVSGKRRRKKKAKAAAKAQARLTSMNQPTQADYDAAQDELAMEQPGQWDLSRSTQQRLTQDVPPQQYDQPQQFAPPPPPQYGPPQYAPPPPWGYPAQPSPDDYYEADQ